ASITAAIPDAKVLVPRVALASARYLSTSAEGTARWKARDTTLSMTERAQVSSAAALLAHEGSLARPAGVVVALVATPSARLSHFKTWASVTDCRSASLPKTFPTLPMVSGGNSPLAGADRSPKRSATALLYSKRVSRRMGARPGFTTPWQATGG